MTLIQQVNEIVSPVYQVGGSVRDELLGVNPKDYDFATPLTPDEVSAKIKEAGRRVYDIGKRYGTVGFTIDGQMIEITTFRSEVYKEGSRKPDVSFVTDLHQDLARRDFTVNAMAKDAQGALIDPFQGENDLGRRFIRAVGNPMERFSEDPLRMLRMYRFQSTLSYLHYPFDVDVLTSRACDKQAGAILNVSRERWVQEMDKMLMGANVYIALWCYLGGPLSVYMFPETSYSNRKELAAKVENARKTIEDRWLAFFSMYDAPYSHIHGVEGERFRRMLVQRQTDYLRFSKERTRFILEN
jgi:poly(A) polymerase